MREPLRGLRGVRSEMAAACSEDGEKAKVFCFWALSVRILSLTRAHSAVSGLREDHSSRGEGGGGSRLRMSSLLHPRQLMNPQRITWELPTLKEGRCPPGEDEKLVRGRMLRDIAIGFYYFVVPVPSSSTLPNKLMNRFKCTYAHSERYRT